MTIRKHVPWPLRAAALIVALAAVGIGAWTMRGSLAIPDFGHNAELNRLRDENQALTAERDKLIAASNITDSRAVMERSTMEQLSSQIKALESENAKLKEDVAFIESITADRQANAGSSIAIRSMQVMQDGTPQQMRYRILVTQGAKADRDFNGELQLVLTLQQGGKPATMVLPGSQSGNAALADPKQFQIGFRSYKRLEGSFRIPADAALKAVQAKVLERGAVRAQQTTVVK